MLFLLCGYAEKNIRFSQDFNVVFASWLCCKNNRFCWDFYVALAGKLYEQILDFSRI